MRPGVWRKRLHQPFRRKQSHQNCKTINRSIIFSLTVREVLKMLDALLVFRYMQDEVWDEVLLSSIAVEG